MKEKTVVSKKNTKQSIKRQTYKTSECCWLKFRRVLLPFSFFQRMKERMEKAEIGDLEEERKEGRGKENNGHKTEEYKNRLQASHFVQKLAKKGDRQKYSLLTNRKENSC